MTYKIYTGNGDEGFTNLYGGKKILKSDPQIEAYGTIDELNSFIGLLMSHVEEKSISSDLIKIQNELFTIGTILATDKENPKLKKHLDTASILFLENKIDDMEKVLPTLRNFILPSGSELVSLAHIARTVTRRAERNIVAMQNDDDEFSKILIFMNRLSDYFFVLSRYLAKLTNVEEILVNV